MQTVEITSRKEEIVFSSCKESDLYWGERGQGLHFL